jgi:F-type H+-transporting ATPase subunit c
MNVVKLVRVLNLLCFVVLALLASSTPLFAQTTPNVPVLSGSGIGAGLGAAITIIGAGYGFGRIGSAALESMARQPEVAPRVQTAMIVIAALLEGATFFSLIVCFVLMGKATF